MITSSANAQMKYLVKLQEKGAARKDFQDRAGFRV